MTTATTRDAHADPACVLAVGLMSLMEHAILHTISPFTARSGHNFFPQRSLYPTCIQAQRTVKASNRMKISNHIARHNTINTGRIRSNQVRHSSTISQRVRWSMGLMVYSDDDFY